MSVRPLGFHNSLSPLSQTGSLMRTSLGNAHTLQPLEPLGNYLQASPLVIPNSSEYWEQSGNFTDCSSLQRSETNFFESPDVGEGVDRQISDLKTANSPQIQKISENPSSETMEAISPRDEAQSAIATLKPLGLPQPLGHIPQPSSTQLDAKTDQTDEAFVSPRLETIQRQLTSETIAITQTLTTIQPSRESPTPVASSLAEVTNSLLETTSDQQVTPRVYTPPPPDTQIQSQSEIKSPEITLPQSSSDSASRFIPLGYRAHPVETNLPSPDARKSDLENPILLDNEEVKISTSDLPAQRQIEPDISTNAPDVVSQKESAQDFHTTTPLITPTIEPTAIESRRDWQTPSAEAIAPLRENASVHTSPSPDTQIQSQGSEITSPETALPQSSSDRTHPIETNLPSPDARKSDLENPTLLDNEEIKTSTPNLPLAQRQIEPDISTNALSQKESAQDFHTTTPLPTPTIEPTAIESRRDWQTPFAPSAEAIAPLQENASVYTSPSPDTQIQSQGSEITSPETALPQSSSDRAHPIETNLPSPDARKSDLENPTLLDNEEVKISTSDLPLAQRQIEPDISTNALSQKESAQDFHTTTPLPTSTIEPTAIEPKRDWQTPSAEAIAPLRENASVHTSPSPDTQIQSQGSEITSPEITLPQSSSDHTHPVETNLPSSDARKSDLENPILLDNEEVKILTSDLPAQRQIEPDISTNALSQKESAQDFHSTTPLPTPTIEPTAIESRRDWQTPSAKAITPLRENASVYTSPSPDTQIQSQGSEITSPQITLPQSSGDSASRFIPLGYRAHPVETNLPSSTKSSPNLPPTAENISTVSLEATPELHLDEIPSPTEPNIVQKTQIEEPQQPISTPEKSTVEKQVQPTPIIVTSPQQPQIPAISTKLTDLETNQPNLHIPTLVQRQPLGLSQLATTPAITSSLSDDSPVATSSVNQKDPETELHTNPIQRVESLNETIQPVLSPTQPKSNQNVAKNTPDTWSNITELLGLPENQTNSEPWEEQFNLQSPITEELISPWAKDTSFNSPDGEGKILPEETLISPLASSDAHLSPHQGKNNSAVDEEQFELLAQTVYRLMRLQFATDRERHNHTSTGYLPWIDVINPSSWKKNNTSSPKTASNSYFTPPIERKLSILTSEVYQNIKIRLEVAKERQCKL